MGLERIGKYQVVAKIGEGAMGEVYKARDPLLNRNVAIKTISASLAADPQFKERFKREAQSAASLNHPNIVTVYEYGDDGGRDLHRDGVPRGGRPPRGDPREGARPPRPQARGDGADQRRRRLRARARRRPPRPQARQRPHPAERPHQDPRLRARPAGRLRADAQRNGDGDPALHVPRAAARAEGRRARRRLLAGRDLLRDPLGPARLREPADARGAGPPARPRARAAAQARPGDAGGCSSTSSSGRWRASRAIASRTRAR